MELITGHHGDTVITSEQWAEYNRMLIGDDNSIVYRSRTSNFCATSTSGLYWTMDTGHLLANGRDIAVDEAETVGTDPTTTYTRIDSIFLEVLRDDTTLAERAEFVLELGTEAEEPIAPDTPTDADDTLTTLLFAIRVADLTVSGEEITSYVDYTEELPGFATYVTQTEHDADKAEVETAYQAADTVIKKEVPWYATSDSAESTIAKIATCNQTGFALATGAKVIVKFDYTNTASSPTLNVNGTGDIAIVAYGTTAPELYWVAGDVVEFTYDGTSWVMHPTQGQVYALNSNLTDLESDLIVQDISVSLALSATSQVYTNTALKNRQYLDVYVRATGADNLSRTLRVYPGLGTGAVIFSGDLNYVEVYQLVYNSSDGTLTYQVTYAQGWNPSTFTIQHIFYQTF
jgi:hypothetical protein